MESSLPCHEQAAPAASAPVFFALESARYLRHEIDQVDTASAADVVQLHHEVAMLRHWISASEVDFADYSALGQGLAEFADDVEQRLPAE